MLHWLSTAINTYLLHPEHGNGYQWHSGIGSDWQELTMLGLAVGAYRHVNCDQSRCWRPGHRHPDHGRPVCRRHYHTVKVPEPPEST